MTICEAVTEVPTAVPVEQGIVRNTGYPDDCLTRCCRIAGHEGMHFTVLPLASAPGTFSWSWVDVEPIACEWCGRAIYRATGRWLAVKGAERGYDPLVCDGTAGDGLHAPQTQKTGDQCTDGETP